MKVWILYYIGDLEKISIEYDNDDETRDKNRIYAVTSNKDLLKEFLSCRNEKVFKIKKIDLLPSEFEELSQSDLRKAVIDRYTLMTDHDSVTMALTDYEYQIASDDFVINSILEDGDYWMHAPQSKIFNKKIQKALNILQYPQSYVLGNPNSTCDEYDAPDISVDELQQFIINFSGTLKM